MTKYNMWLHKEEKKKLVREGEAGFDRGVELTSRALEKMREL